MKKPSIPYPTIGIDIDGTITENPLFFNVLTNSWPGLVVIVSYREDHDAAKDLLDSMNIKYDKLILSSQMDKSDIIKEEEIDIFFDDQDEVTGNVPDGVTIFKIRNEGNFDFEDKKWMYSKKTGKIIS